MGALQDAIRKQTRTLKPTEPRKVRDPIWDVPSSYRCTGCGEPLTSQAACDRHAAQGAPHRRIEQILVREDGAPAA